MPRTAKKKEKDAMSLAERAQTVADRPPAGSSNRVVIAVIGRDRPGIMAGVTGILAHRSANILDVSQTIMSELFTMIMLVDIDGIRTPFAELKQELEAHGRREGLSIITQHEDLFRAMHRV